MSRGGLSGLMPAVLRSASGLLPQPAQPIRLLYCERFPQSSGVLPIRRMLFRQSLKPRALNAVAFQDNSGFVFPVYSIALDNSVRERQRPIHSRHTIAQHNFRFFAHRAENLAAGQRRTDRIAIRPRMRRQQETVAPLDMFENFSQHTTSNFQPLFFLVRVSNWSILAPYWPDRSN